jgi:hypothetical protein
MARIRFFVATLQAAMFVSPGVPAQSPRSDPAAAEVLFREAHALLQKKEYDAACPKLEQSHRLDPAVGTVALLAYCHEQQGKLATAWQEYLDAARMARDAKQSDREKVARAKAAELEQRVSTLTIFVEDPRPDLQVTLRGRSVARAEWGVAVPVDPGSTEIEARAPGFEPWRTSVTVPGERAVLEARVPRLVALPKRASPAPRPAPSPQPPPAADAEPSWLSQNALAVVVFGVGAAGLGVGTYFGLRAKAKNDDSKPECPDNQCTDGGLQLRDQALEAATVSTVAFGVGLAGIATGVVLLVASSDGDREARLTLAPTLGGLRLRGAF